MKKLFFTGGGGAGNEAMWRYFNNDYDVHFGDADIQSIDLAIPQTNRHKIPYANSLDFIENLSEPFIVTTSNYVIYQNSFELKVDNVCIYSISQINYRTTVRYLGILKALFKITFNAINTLIN